MLRLIVITAIFLVALSACAGAMYGLVLGWDAVGDPYVKERATIVDVSVNRTGIIVCDNLPNVTCASNYFATALTCVHNKEHRLCLEEKTSFLAESDEAAERYASQLYFVGATRLWYVHWGKNKIYPYNESPYGGINAGIALGLSFAMAFVGLSAFIVCYVFYDECKMIWANRGSVYVDVERPPMLPPPPPLPPQIQSEIHTETSPDRECVICFESIAVGDSVFVCSDCNQKVIHLKCASSWGEVQKTCPLCRKEFVSLSA